MLVANLHIVTADQGLGRYQTIPLEGKKSYKLANVNSKSDSFSIIAVTVDTFQPSQVLRIGATQSNIEAVCKYLGDIEINSTTGTIYVSVAPVKQKQNLMKSQIGKASELPTAKIITSALGLGTSLYNWYKGSSDEEFNFTIGAHETSTTKVTVKAPLSLSKIMWEVERVSAFSDTNYAKQAKTGTLALGEMGQQAKEMYSFYGSPFNYLFKK